MLLLLICVVICSSALPTGLKQCGADNIDVANGLTLHYLNSETSTCNMPVLDLTTTTGSSTNLFNTKVAQHLAKAQTPVLIRGLLNISQSWREQHSLLGIRQTLIKRFGTSRLTLSVGKLLSHGPESILLDKQKVKFMQDTWAHLNSTILGIDFLQQVKMGRAQPTMSLEDWMRVLWNGASPIDAYVFQNVSYGPIFNALNPMRKLWHATASAQWDAQPYHDYEMHNPNGVGKYPPVLARLGIGGSGSGAPFHDHFVIALNMVFEGRKRWLVTRPCSPRCQIPFFHNHSAVFHPEFLLKNDYFTAALTHFGGDTWDCIQRSGELVYIPTGFLHATVNLDETVAVAMQYDDG